MRIKYSGIVILLATTFFLSCKKEYSCEGCINGNIAPNANAGPDQVITLPADSISLDGSASSDPDGMISSYFWTKISGPASFSLIRSSDSITKVKSFVAGTYLFELKVTDNNGSSATDTTSVTVTDLTDHPSSEISFITGCNSSMTTFGHFPIPAMGTRVVSAGGKIFFSWYNPNSNIIHGTSIYDTITQTWSSTSYPYIGEINTGTKLITPLGDRFEIYDASTGTSNTYSIPEALNGIQHDITGSRVVFAGGYLGVGISAVSKRIDIYDNATNSWTLVNYDSARYPLRMAAIGSKIFFAGGYSLISPDSLYVIDDDGNGYWYHPIIPLPRVDIYDMQSNTWSTWQLSEPGANFVTAKVGNKLLFFHNNSTKIDIYDVSTNSWFVRDKPDQSSWGHDQFGRSRTHVVGNKVLFTNLWSDKVGIYDVTNNSWSIKQMLKPNGQTDYLVAVAKNKVLFFYVFDYEDHSAAVDIYDATTNSWCHGELNRSLVRSAIGVVGNKIYIAGGHTKTNPQGVYDQYLDNIWIFNF